MAYRRRFDDNDVDNMQKDAAAAEKITDAERRMALAGNLTNNLNNQRADIAAAAHERRMASRARFLGAGHGVVSPQERAEIEAFRFNQGLTGRESALQQHEMNMLKQRGENDKAVAFERRMGMKEQGSDAAKINAEASITNTEREWAGRENIARQQGKDSLLTEQERQRGGLAIAKQQGKDSLLTEKDRQGGALALETKRGENAAEINKATLESQERINKATLAAQQGRKGAMTPEQESAAARDLIKQTSRNGMPTMSYEDALKQIRGGGQQGGEAWPGYTAERTAELKKRGYTLVNGEPVKAQ